MDPGEQLSDNIHCTTPADFLDLVRRVAAIGLDPCSNAQSVVAAKVEWRGDGPADNGLVLPWRGHGLVYCNPPYGTHLPAWAKKIASEARAGAPVISLVPARTETRWFRTLTESCTARCFLRRRLRFGEATSGAKFPSAVFLHGEALLEEFVSVFGAEGEITIYDTDGQGSARGSIVGAYVRVSSLAQSHEMQLSAVRRAATARGDVIDEVYSEKRTAKTIDRAELERVRVDARAGRLRRLYVFRLDRLARSGIRDTLEVVDELQGHGCEIITISDGFDMTGPAAPVVLSVMAWAAQMERLAINERIAHARQCVADRGGRWGRPRRMDDDQVQRARALAAEGQTVRQIAEELLLPRAVVGRALVGVRRGVPERSTGTTPSSRREPEVAS